MAGYYGGWPTEAIQRESEAAVGVMAWRGGQGRVITDAAGTMDY